MALSQQSRSRLAGVHQDLVRLVRAVDDVGAVTFVVGEGVRTPQRQQQLVAAGASWTTNSRHITGHAVDLFATVDGVVRWDWPLYIRLAKVVQLVAQRLDIPVRWGGTWRLLNTEPLPFRLHAEIPDGPHYELDRGRYP